MTSTRREFLLGAALAGIVAGCSGGDDDGVAPVSSVAPSPSSGSTPPPNVLYITADDLGTRLGAYGHPGIHTPNIDRLAAESLVFDELHCQIPICGPSRSSILTGLRPETTGILRNDDPWRELAPSAVTLPRLFRDSGYRTYAIGKIEDLRNGDLDDAWDVVAEPRSIQGEQHVVDFIAAVEVSSPFFVAVGFDEPHCPWTPSEKARAEYTPEEVAAELGPGREITADQLTACAPEVRGPLDGDAMVELTEAEAAALAAGYLASVTDLDALVGATLAAAEANGLLDNTIVIFWSGDHGYALGDANWWGKWVPFRNISHIPLVMRLPDGRGAGSRVPGLVEAIDMYPTLVEMCGLAPPVQLLDGASFAAAFDDPSTVGKAHVFSRFGNQRSISDREWNLIHDDFWGTDALYDLVDDPGELDDVSAAHPDVVAELWQRLESGP